MFRLRLCWSESFSGDAALRIGAVIGWNEHESGAQLEAFETERSAILRKPARSASALEAAAD